jgi:WD40 repeat protein
MFSLNGVDSFRFPGIEEVYVTNVVPLAKGPATISSDQKLCLFNPLSLRPGPVTTLQTNHGNVTCLKAIDANSSTVCTTGDNGSISLWDLRLEATQAEVARLTSEHYEFEKYQIWMDWLSSIQIIQHHSFRWRAQAVAFPLLLAQSCPTAKHPF